MTQGSIGQSFEDPDKTTNDAEFKSEHTTAPEAPAKRWSPSDQIISLEEAVAQIKSAHQAYAAISLKTRMEGPKIASFCSRVSICGSMGSHPEGPSRSDGISLMLSRLRRFDSRHADNPGWS
jgi:hypothetical protein